MQLPTLDMAEDQVYDNSYSNYQIIISDFILTIR